jgi:hypothetical protein
LIGTGALAERSGRLEAVPPYLVCCHCNLTAICHRNLEIATYMSSMK